MSEDIEGQAVQRLVENSTAFNETEMPFLLESYILSLTLVVHTLLLTLTN